MSDKAVPASLIAARNCMPGFSFKKRPGGECLVGSITLLWGST